MFLYTEKMPRSRSALGNHKEAIRERERILTKEKANARRFNDPLKLFVQRKYKHVYREYCELYNRMVSELPARKNLSKTLVFRQFLLDHPDDHPNEQVSEQTRRASGKENRGPCESQKCTSKSTSRDVLYIPQIELQPVVPLAGAVEEPLGEVKDGEPNILVQALAEIIDSEPVELGSPEYDFRVEEVHAILEEMSKELDILNQVDENLPEGGGVEYFDDFDKDIQLFNHSFC